MFPQAAKRLSVSLTDRVFSMFDFIQLIDYHSLLSVKQTQVFQEIGCRHDQDTEMLESKDRLYSFIEAGLGALHPLLPLIWLNAHNSMRSILQSCKSLCLFWSLCLKFYDIDCRFSQYDRLTFTVLQLWLWFHLLLWLPYSIWSVEIRKGMQPWTARSVVFGNMNDRLAP